MSSDPITELRPKREEDAEWQTRVDLAACYRLTAHFGFDDVIWNHISARLPGRANVS